ncbi:cct2 [Symbiodinium microadriaticum]|nr:cct2 [Symbiodinium microadriaticum]
MLSALAFASGMVFLAPQRSGRALRVQRAATADAVQVKGELSPLFDYVLIKAKEAVTSTKSGLLLPTSSEKPSEGEVVAVGPGAVQETGVQVPVWAQVGMKVLHGKYGVEEVKYNDEDHVLVRDDDVLLSYSGDEPTLESIQMPRGKVLLKLLDEKEESQGGILLSKGAAKPDTTIGEVVAVGEDALDRFGKPITTDLAVGDTVRFRFGNEVKLDLGKSEFRSVDVSECPGPCDQANFDVAWPLSACMLAIAGIYSASSCLPHFRASVTMAALVSGEGAAGRHKALLGGPEIFKEGAGEDRGEFARLQAFIGAIAIGDMVKSTLGPKGMDKILQPAGQGPGSNATVTNDGATILKSVWIDNPAARILVDISKTQDQECGDGTTSVVVLAAEMLRNAQNLVEAKMHPQVIIRGYRMALAAARAKLEALAMDNGSDPVKFREDLLRIARTTLSSKLLQHEKDHFATLAVDAVLRLGGKPNLDYIQVLKKPGASLKDSFLEEGFILEKRIGVGHKKLLEDCKVLVANCQMDTDKVKIYGARVKVDSLEAVAEIEQAEKEKMKAKIEKIAAHKCNVFINRQLIYNYPDQLLKESGVMAIEHSDFDGSERLAAVLGADIVSTFDNPELTTLGTCKKIEEIMIGEDKVIKFSGCSKGEACTIVLRGSSTHVLDEAERSLHDALAVLYQTVQETRVVWGGGAMEMAMAQEVQQKLTEVSGKESAAMEAFGKALTQIPVILADNAGLDAAELAGQLRAAHAKGEHSTGLEFTSGSGGVADMKQLGIMESFRSKMSQLCSAAEAAEMIIRVDDIIKNAPRQRDG